MLARKCSKAIDANRASRGSFFSRRFQHMPDGADDVFSFDQVKLITTDLGRTLRSRFKDF